MPHKSGSYTSKSACEVLKEHREAVNWWRIVWFKGYIPKLAFITWFGCKQSLLNKERLKHWGRINDDICVLCGASTESLNLLFFQCVYSKNVWKIVQYRNGTRGAGSTWEEEVQNAIKENSGSSFEARIKNLSLVASVYYIWQERNNRIFKNAAHNWEFVMARISDCVKEVSWNWRASRNYKNWAMYKLWGLYEQFQDILVTD